jgi:hypothetical protein
MAVPVRLGVLDVALLEACEVAGASDDSSFVNTRRALDVLHERVGVGPRTAYEPLCDLARPWVAHLTLVDFRGNYGSPDDLPANPRYTECRLSSLGAAALASERGQIGPLPIGLINGNTHVSGCRPPLDPRRTVAAIRAAARDSASDEELVQIVGPPSFPATCDVVGDFASFAAGTETELHLSARIESVGEDLAISDLPPDSSADEIAEQITRQAGRLRSDHIADVPGEFRNSLHQIRGVRDESTASGTRLIVELTQGSDRAEVRDFLWTIWDIRRTMTVHLDQPLASHIRIAAADPVGLDERLGLIEAAIRH